MTDKIDIFCPVCSKTGVRKGKLLEVDKEARGIIYPYCKSCHKNVRIELKGVEKGKSE